jgi:hypothetical protein
VRVTLVSPAELAGLVEEAGLVVDWQQERDPYPTEHPTRRLYLWARHAA